MKIDVQERKTKEGLISTIEQFVLSASHYGLFG